MRSGLSRWCLLALALLAPVNARAQLAAGDSAWAARDFKAARAFYSVVVRADSAASSRAVFRLATMLAWDDELDASLQLHRLYVRLEPEDAEGRAALARTLAWAARYGEAIATYDSILARDPGYRDAALGAAQALAWQGRFSEAIARYEKWIAAHHGDAEARIALARTLSWAGRLRDAERIYASAAAAGDSAEALKGLARVSAWGGELNRSVTLWERLAARYPDDPEVWTGLGQVLRWRNQPEDAQDALQRALAARPGYPDAVQQLMWVRAELGTAVEPTFASTTDSDHSSSTTLSLSASARPVRRGRVALSVLRRDAATRNTRATVSELRAGGRAWPRAGTMLSAEVGASQLNGDAASGVQRTDPLFALGAYSQLTSLLAASAGISRSPFTETAPLINRGIVMSALDLAGDITPPGPVSASVAFGLASFSRGSVPNSRRSASGALRYTVRRGLSLGLGTRHMAYANNPGDGYFAPKRFTLTEASARWLPGRDLGWFGVLDGGLGLQRMRFDGPVTTRGAQRIAGTLGYRFSPRAEASGQVWFANVASGSGVTAVRGGSDYKARGLALRARLVR